MILLLLLNSGWTTAQMDTLRTITEPNTGLTFKYPSSWHIVPNEQALIAIVEDVLHPTSFRANINVVVTEVDSRMTLKQYALANRKKLLSALPVYKEHEFIPVKLPYVSAWKLDYSWFYDGFGYFRCILIMFIDEDKAFGLTIMTIPEKFENHRIMISRIIDSIECKDD